MRNCFGILVLSVLSLCLLVILNNFSKSSPTTSQEFEGKSPYETPISAQNEITVVEYMKGPLLQNDSRIINYIKTHNYLQSPSSLPYNLTQPTLDPSMGQSQIVKTLFKGKRQGFFVECGALDGETRSNTLSLERDFGWEGLLVEGDPKNYEMVLAKNRKAWTAGCCLSIHPYPHEVTYEQKFNQGAIKTDEAKPNVDARALQDISYVKVQCFPIFSLLTALGIKTVDYFSLDVEGFEMDVIKTIPFDSLDIKVLTVEFFHGEGGADELINVMAQRGYRVITKLTHGNHLANDIIFAHSSFEVTGEYPSHIKSESMKLN